MNKFLLTISFLIISSTVAYDSFAQCNEQSYSNSGTFIVPEGITEITLKAWGAGGKGGDRNKNKGRSGGGGSGAYSESTISVVPGETIYYFAGSGSNSSAPGGDSWISRSSNGSNPIILAKGGRSANTNSTSGASGGRADEGIGTIRENGENGQNAGGNGGNGGSSPNGGAGGLGAVKNNEGGNPGEAPGGGGGGAKTVGNNTVTGGNGGNGQITFSFGCDLSGCWRYIDDGSESGVVIIEFYEDCTWEAPANLAEFEVLTVGGGGGGGFDLGGGGGAGGLVHTRAVVTEIEVNGLPANTTFEIKVGSGGEGSDDENEEGEDGSESTFDLGGIYEVKAAGGGGGGTGSWNKRKGNNGTDSYYNETTIGYSVVEETTGDQKPRFFGSSGGGAGNSGNNNHRGQGGNNGKMGGRGRDGAGGGGGGAAEDGNNAAEERGGKGGAGLIVTEFDNRVFAAGGGGAGEEDRGLGGANLRGGNGGRGSNNHAEDGQTPGSGGGGGRDSGRGGRGSNGVVIVRYEIARILPVEFLSFQSTYQVAKRTGLLEWSTAKEWENSHFEIERAINSVDSWTKIGEIQGQGFADSPTSYSFEDINLPIQGGNIFYRLKQVDFDGTYTYSRTTAIQIEGQKGNKIWRAYPNPTNGYSFQIGMIDPSSYRDEPISIRVISPTGLYHYIRVDDIQTMGKQVGDWLIGQTAGIYTIEIVWGTNREYHKVILKR